MKVHPAIAALRSGTGSQRSAAVRNARAVEAVKLDWHARIEVARISDDLARYAAGASLTECEALGELMSAPAAAHAFVEILTGSMIWALRGEPLSEVPLRYKCSAGFSTLHLLAKGPALLSVSAYEPLEASATPASAVFSDRSCAELVISGQAHGMVHRRAGRALLTETGKWTRGQVIRTDPMIGARQVVAVQRTLVLLQLSRSAKAPRPSEEVALPDGRLCRTASGDKTASQAVMALSVLGALGAQHSIAMMDRTARNRREDHQVRWEAVRQTIGLDAQKGLTLLDLLASDNGDPLSASASNLATSLRQAHPALRDLTTEPACCR